MLAANNLSDIRPSINDCGNPMVYPASYKPLISILNMDISTYYNKSVRVTKPAYIPSGTSYSQLLMFPLSTSAYPDNETGVSIDDIVIQECLPEVRYYQNTNSLPNICLSNKDIYAGMNVTSSITQGLVTILNGSNITFKSANNVYLQDGFIVNNGATFLAIIEPTGLISCGSASNTTNLREDQTIIDNIVTKNKSDYNLNMNTDSLFTNSELVSVFPNPSIDYINLSTKFEEATDLELIVFNIEGGEIIRSSKKGLLRTSIKIDLNSHKEGTYFVKILYLNKTYIKKIILTH